MRSPYPHPLFEDSVRHIGEGDLDAMRTCLNRVPELVEMRTSNPMSATLLHYTSFNAVDELTFKSPPATPAIARLLIEFGAQPDSFAFESSRSTPLCWALSSWFTYSGGVQAELADAYLDGGASIDGVDGDGAPLGHAIAFGYTSSVEHLATRGARTTDLYAASALGDVERVMSWLGPNGCLDEKALAFAKSDKRETGRFSWPPPSSPDPSALSLITAATHGRLDLVRALLDAGVNPNATVTRNQTALHFAAYGGYREVCEALIDHGAKRATRERQFDRTPAEWARETGEDAIATILEQL